MVSGSGYLRGKPIRPKKIISGISAAELIEETFLAYNAGRLREACRLFTRKMLEPDVTVGLSITGFSKNIRKRKKRSDSPSTEQFSGSHGTMVGTRTVPGGGSSCSL